MRAGCRVCSDMPPGDLLELDLLMGDPLRWPMTVWSVFAPPEGGLPASYRRFGALKMGLTWLDEHGYSGAFSKQQVRQHWRFDVPTLSIDVDALIARGVVAEGKRAGSTTEAIDPLAYIKLYAKGIDVGIRGLELLAKRVDGLIEKGEEVPLGLVKMLVDAGMRLATSQAHIKAAGKPFGDAGLDENAAFMGGDDISPKMGHSRVRMIDGHYRPVADEGMADRAHYNERAAQEGRTPIGGR